MLTGLIKTMRPKQWAKNGFLFAALIFDRKLSNFPALLTTLAGFLIFSLLASTVYIINDLYDIEADRQHPEKRTRPIASGKLPTAAAWAAVVIFLLIIFPAAYLLSKSFAVFALVYFLLNLSYSAWLKHIPLIDVLILASFYVIRVGAGVALIQVERFSPWLYVFTTFLALYLGIGKRRAELMLMTENTNNRRKVLDGYTVSFLDQLISIVLTLTIFTYSLYTFSAPNLPNNYIMMLTIPFVIYGIFRYLYLVHVENHGESPEDILFSDRPLQASIVLWGLSVLAIFYFY
ncbi:MAG: decaprenyl-phosphate phosphoribosyltransferase [Anaerolineae bacterium]|nr:decaprenyl-phosphate phosphoribosyltransferase [Anaerolineae bacterium]